MAIVNICGICGGSVHTHAPKDWHPTKRARRAERDMQAHLKSHSFAEVLRYEIRQDLEQVPDDQRPAIIRDLYRTLLGTTESRVFRLNDTDGHGTYTIDEALGTIDAYRLWLTAERCGRAHCTHTAADSV
ncbi:MAG: hypothetical protein NVSMB2_07810 [Chloroflexota bacterium]